jgi:hypothetical protein
MKNYFPFHFCLLFFCMDYTLESCLHENEKGKIYQVIISSYCRRNHSERYSRGETSAKEPKLSVRPCFLKQLIVVWGMLVVLEWFLFTVKSSNFVRGSYNFVTPAANFCDQMPGLLRQLSKIFKNILSFKKFSLLMLF